MTKIDYLLQNGFTERAVKTGGFFSREEQLKYFITKDYYFFEVWFEVKCGDIDLDQINFELEMWGEVDSKSIIKLSNELNDLTNILKELSKMEEQQCIKK